MRIIAIIDNSGPKAHRIKWPMMMMDNVEYEFFSKIQEENVRDCDVLFFNRLIPGITLNQLLTLREKYGFKMICDLDDHWRLDPSHLLYEQYKHFETTEIITEYIKVSDLILVTHERLYKEVLPLNKNVHIIPNAIPKSGQFLFPKQQDEKVRLFWSGSVTHRIDLELLRNPLKRFKGRNVKMVIGGYLKKEENEQQVVKIGKKSYYMYDRPEWEKMLSIVKDSGIDLDVIEFLPVDKYYGVYSKCDISLIPLVKNSFNPFKSNLKILESANIGAPVVVSRVDPYLGFPERFVNYVARQGDWFELINNLVGNESMRIEQGLELQEYCDRVYNFESINEHRRQILYDTGKH